MSEQVMGLDKDNHGMSKKSVHAYESAWLGRWARTGSEKAQPSQSRLSLKEDAKCSKESSVVGPEITVGDSAFGEKCRDVVDTEENLKENHGRKRGNEGWDVSPFPVFNVSQRRESVAATRIVENTPCGRFQAYPKMEASLCFHEGEGSNSKAMAMRRPLTPSWIHSRHENALPAPSFEHNENVGSNHNHNIPVQVKSTLDQLNLIRQMTVYETINSVEGTSKEPQSFSQATPRFILSKRTDLNLSEDNQMLRESAVSMKLKGKMFSGFLDLFPTLDPCHREGARLQSLGSSKDSEEGPRKTGEVESPPVCARNESSAETDTLEMDNFQRIRLSGSTSSLSPKDHGSENQSTAVPRIEIPDMNNEPPVVPDREISADGDGGEASTSETRSMNVEHFNIERFRSNTELPKECKRMRSDPEPCNPWVKRLKTSAPDSSGRGTKNMKTEEASPGQKVNNFFHKNIKCGVTDPEPRIEEPPNSQAKNAKLGGQDITLLHPWIQRWCKNKAETSHQPGEQDVDCEPETSKETALEEVQKKQFPSIAAMALMGKALSGLSPSGLRKSGSMIIWNSPDLR